MVVSESGVYVDDKCEILVWKKWNICMYTTHTLIAIKHQVGRQY